MILRRLGNKKKIAKQIQDYFPPHKIYIEPFFGAGGMFFNKPVSKYNILNDLDDDVFNVFMVLKENKKELEKAINDLPVNETLFNYWFNNKEDDKIYKALRFLFLSNFSFMGKADTLHFSFNTNKLTLLENLEKTYQFIIRQKNGTIFMNEDFRLMFKKIVYQKDGRNDEDKTFVYCDPPYLETTDNYSNSFTEADSLDLFNILEATGIKYAISEFNHPFILKQAEERGLNIIYIGERNNLKNKRTEILITNYVNAQTALF